MAYIGMQRNEIIQQERNSADTNYIGIGMDIIQENSGEFVCYPYPGGPADKAGIISGDILTAIDGNPVHGKSKFALVNLTRGKQGSRMTVTVKNREGSKAGFTVIRSPIHIKTVSLNFIEQLPVIRIHSFGITTLRELKKTIERLPENKPFIIDLRKNPGGDLHSAIDAAMLFLKKNDKIVGVKKDAQVRWYRAYNNPLIKSGVHIFLWQVIYRFYIKVVSTPFYNVVFIHTQAL